jgi:hypothetical protein
MKQPQSHITYYAADTTTRFPIPFGFISTEHIQVFLNGTTAEYLCDTSTNPPCIKLFEAPAWGSSIEIRRKTPHPYDTCVPLSGQELEQVQLQFRYILEEQDDELATFEENVSDIREAITKRQLLEKHASTLETIEKNASNIRETINRIKDQTVSNPQPQKRETIRDYLQQEKEICNLHMKLVIADGIRLKELEKEIQEIGGVPKYNKWSLTLKIYDVQRTFGIPLRTRLRTSIEPLGNGQYRVLTFSKGGKVATNNEIIKCTLHLDKLRAHIAKIWSWHWERIVDAADCGAKGGAS